VSQNESEVALIVKVKSILSIDLLKQLSSPRLLNVLRYWIIHQLEKQPTRNLLQEIERTLIHSSADAKPLLVFSGSRFKKFQNCLYLIEAPDVSADSLMLDWQLPYALDIVELNIRLQTVEIDAAHTQSFRLDNNLRNKKLTLRFRQGGEVFHPAGRQHSQRLKKLFQEAGIPPWERDVTPLLYDEDELIAVPGHWLSKKHLAKEGEAGWQILVTSL
jgi:tRNA(Ile)-lysidine synthase